MLDAIVGLIGAALQAQAIANQQAIERESLNETKRSNKQRERLATSSREDAYGDLLYYDPQLGWKLRVTPTTRGILNAEQMENLASLREDAPRQREASVRKDARSREGDELFSRLLTELKYRDKPSRAQAEGEGVRQALSARRKGLDEGEAILARQLIRTGSSDQIPSLVKSVNDTYAQSLEEAMLQGKAAGRQTFASNEAQDLSRLLQELGFAHGIADDTDNAPLRFTNTNNELSGRADQALGTSLQTLAQNSQLEQSAYDALAQAMGRSPDLSGIASGLSSLMSGMGGRTSVDPTVPTAARAGVNPIPFPRPYEEGLLARQRAYARGF